MATTLAGGAKKEVEPVPSTKQASTAAIVPSSSADKGLDKLSAGEKKGSNAATEAVKKPGKKLESLQALRYITAVQMVWFHYFQNTPNKLFNQVNVWGNSPFTFILGLSGFVMAYGYGRSNKPIDVTEFCIKRWANLYPLYAFTVVAGYLLIPKMTPQPLGLLVVLTLGLSGFVPTAFINPINTPGWTIGSLFVLYAIFPFSCRMLRAASPRFRLWVLVPFFFLCSIAKPLADQSWNLGVISGGARLIALSSIPDFLQGINVGLLFLEHDWSKHPWILQKFGMSIGLAAACLLFVYIDLAKQPMWIQLWRAYGMLQPVWFPVIWYAAHGKDILAYIFELPFVSYLGSTSYGVYIMQQLLIDYKWQNDQFLLQHQYPKVFEFIFVLTIMGALGYHFIQLPYTPYIIAQGMSMLKKYRASKTAGVVDRVTKLTLESLVSRCLITAAFVVSYVLYVNFQPCYDVNMSYANGRMASHKWFNQNDWEWLVNWYAIPCTPRRLIPEAVEVGLYWMIAGLMGLAAAGLVIQGTKIVAGLLNGSKSESDEEPSTIDLGDAAVVVRLIVRPTDSLAAIKQTLDYTVKAIDSLKAERKITIEVLGLTKEGPIQYTSPLPVEVSTINMAFELARTRSQIQPKDILITLPVGAKILSGEELNAILRQNSSEAVVMLPLSADGSADALPSLGTLADLNPLAPKMSPSILVGSASLQQNLPAHTVLAAVAHGGVTVTETAGLQIQNPSSKDWARHETPSLTSYLQRRFAFNKSVGLTASHGAKAAAAIRLLGEAAFHAAFALSIAILVGTPVHLSYTDGMYCNYYWSTMCTNGTPSGFSNARGLVAILAALYSGGYFARFLHHFRATEGGFVRQIILTFLLLFFLPLTAVVDAVGSFLSFFYLILPAEEEGASTQGGNQLASPSLVA